MKVKIILCNLLIVIFICGCATLASKMNKLSIGMNKAQVIEIMGDPITTRASEANEFLKYKLYDTAYDALNTSKSEFWVGLQNNKVYFYGRPGDFGTTQPRDRREYDININKQ